MKGDFTKQTFRPEKHYSSVRMQQGRVQTDADWNEQADIIGYAQSTMAQDLFGQSGAPLGTPGFRIDTVRSGSVITDVTISAGRFYAGGVLCENEATLSIGGQPDLPALAGAAPFFSTAGNYLVYLDVWSRHITANEDPTIRETVLGGVDTGTRVKTVWQVKTKALSSITAVTSDLANVRSWGSVQPGLLAEFASSTAAPSSQILVARAGNAQLENRLYRIEVHSADDKTLALKWSRDNGTFAFPCSVATDSTVLVSGVSIDLEDGFALGQTVEITDDARELRGEPGVLMQITAISSQVGVGLSLSLSPISSVTPPFSQRALGALWKLPANAKLRRWDGVLLTAPPVAAGPPLKLSLESGLYVQLFSGTYSAHDYWNFVTRADTGLDWPSASDGTPQKRPAHGIQHRYAPLALLQVGAGSTLVASVDCRYLFPSLGDTASAPALANLNSAFSSLSGIVNDPNTGIAKHETRINGLNSAVTALNGTVSTLNATVNDSNTGLARHEARLNSLTTQIDNLQEDLAATGAVTGTVSIGSGLFGLNPADTLRISALKDYGYIAASNICQFYFAGPKVDIFQNNPQVTLAMNRNEHWTLNIPTAAEPIQDCMGIGLASGPTDGRGAIEPLSNYTFGVSLQDLEIVAVSSNPSSVQFYVNKERLSRINIVYGNYGATGRVRSIFGIAATTSPDGGIDLFVSTRLRDLRVGNRRPDFASAINWSVISGTNTEFWGPPSVVSASTGGYSVIAMGACGRLLEAYRLGSGGTLSPTWQVTDHDARRVDVEAPSLLPVTSPPDSRLSQPTYAGNTSVLQLDTTVAGVSSPRPYRLVLNSPTRNWDYVNDPIALAEGGEYDPGPKGRLGRLFTYSNSGKVVFLSWSNDPARVGVTTVDQGTGWPKVFTYYDRTFSTTPDAPSNTAQGPTVSGRQSTPPRHTFGTTLFPYLRSDGQWSIAELRPTPQGWNWAPSLVYSTSVPAGSTTLPALSQVAVYGDTAPVARRFLMWVPALGLFDCTLAQAEWTKLKTLTSSASPWHAWTIGTNLISAPGSPGLTIAKFALAVMRTGTQTVPNWWTGPSPYTLPIQPALPCSAFCTDTSGNLWEVTLGADGKWTWRSYGSLPGTKPGCDPTAALMAQAGGTYVAVGYIAGQNGRIFELRNGLITDLGRPY